MANNMLHFYTNLRLWIHKKAFFLQYNNAFIMWIYRIVYIQCPNTKQIHKKRQNLAPLSFLALIMLFITLCATSSFSYDYSHCKRYFKAASTPVNQSYAISLKNPRGGQYHLMYAPSAPSGVKILKADPFIGLYLISAPNTKQSYELLPLDSRTLNDKNLAFISADKANVGHITKRQNGFLDYARFSSATQRNGVLGNICYQIYGIGVGNGQFIEKKYIDRFLSQKTPYYGDIGIRFSSSKAIVGAIDPFSQNAFSPNDEIISINGSKIANANEAEWIISNLKKDSFAKVLIKRNGKTMQINAKVGQRYGGFLLGETFLERFGIHIDENMLIKSINPNQAGRFAPLRVGDTILWINKHPIITESTNTARKIFDRFRDLLSQTRFDERFDGEIQLLIMRNNLEIFIKL